MTGPKALAAGLVTFLLVVGSAGADETMKEVLASSGVKGGLVVHVGCGDGASTAALRAGEGYLVHGLDRDAANVAKARLRIAEAGLYGAVSVAWWSGGSLPYVDNLVNLLVWEDPAAAPMDEVMRVLAPGGAVYKKTEDGWAKTLKLRSDELDQWTHFLHDATNNPVAKDRVVGPPKRLQWICPPAWSKHHERYPPTIPLLVSAAGRVFYFEEETPPCIFNVKTRWFLTARDAFNGVLLWRLPATGWLPEAWPGSLGEGLSGGPADYKRRLIAVGDRLYVTPGHSSAVLELDAATGKTIRTICEGGVHVELLCEGGVLYAIVGSGGKTGLRITAYDTKTARRLWTAPGGRDTAIWGGRLFFQDGPDLVAIDAATGKQIWRAPATLQSGQKASSRRNRAQSGGPIRAGAGVLLISPARGTVGAFSAETGKRLWTYKNLATHTGTRGCEAYIIDGLVWITGVDAGKASDRLATETRGLDPKTGEVKKTVPSGAVWNTGHHRRCYPGKATERFIIYSRRGVDFLELGTGEVRLNNWTRGSCGYGVMPANGLLYSPPHACRCYSEAAIRGLHALAPAAQAPAASDEANRLEQGPAYGQAAIRPSTGSGLGGNPTDWPTYRHDAQRSGAASTAVPTTLKQRWQVRLKGKVTSPVIAGGKVFVARPDAHTVHALDAKDGRALWTYTAGGRIDTPPTIHEGLALFGCADGWVYCLSAADGRLAWRFRAAPRDRRMGVDGQLESVWPVHGAVLVQNRVAYAAAGRCSYTDGGIYVSGLDVRTGKQLHAHRLHGPFTGAGETRENPSMGFISPGTTPDVLVGDGRRIYMRHMAMDAGLTQAVDMLPNFYKAPQRSGENFGGDHKFWCDLLEAGPRAFVGKPQWDHRSYFENFPGKRLYSTVGLLDDSWHIRSYWSYGQVVGQQIVFAGDRGYAVRAYPNAARWAAFQAGQGYELYAGNTAEPKPGEKMYALQTKEHLWSVKLPLRPQAMVLAGATLFLAGSPDPADAAEALAALEGRRGAQLWAVSTADGSKLAEHELDSPPTFDGLAAAGGCLFLSTRDGQILCFGAEN